jgi:hypothetical protein
MPNEESNSKILELTFQSGSDSAPGWCWKIPQNPRREPGKFTPEELEVKRLAQGQVPQVREVWRPKVYVYWAPFNYPNVQVELGRPGTGCEFNVDSAELDIYPHGAITVEEEEPITAVTVIGSGCSIDAWVVLEAEPLVWKFPRTAVRMRKDNLW